MPIRSRPPRHPALVPLLRVLWVSTSGPPLPDPPLRERVLPTGAMHLVFRLGGESLRVFADETDVVGRQVGTALLGGARTTAYLRDVSVPSSSVGAQLRPGAAPVLLGLPARELAGQHLSLDALWGAAAAEAFERLAAVARSPEQQLDLLEDLLVRRLVAGRALDPVVAHALRRFETSADVGGVVAETGRSHRHFIELFHGAVGMQPQLYCRIVRFQRALALHAAAPSTPWAEVAVAAGYADQPHLIRDFGRFAGISPGRYGRVAPALPNHVAVSALSPGEARGGANAKRAPLARSASEENGLAAGGSDFFTRSEVKSVQDRRAQRRQIGSGTSKRSER